MSGYLARLVRRHGDAAAIRPRLEPRVAWPQLPHEMPAAHVTRPPAPRHAVAPLGESRDEPMRSAEPPAASPSPRALSTLLDRGEAPMLPADERGPHVALPEVSAPRIVHATSEPQGPVSEPRPVTHDDVLDRPSAGEGSEIEWGVMERPPDVPVRPAMPRAAAMPRPAVPAPAAQPHVVRIHIGRVEVRALAPPPPTKGSRPARPSGGLSLDQYLAGKRRP